MILFRQPPRRLPRPRIVCGRESVRKNKYFCSKIQRISASPAAQLRGGLLASHPPALGCAGAAECAVAQKRGFCAQIPARRSACPPRSAAGLRGNGGAAAAAQGHGGSVGLRAAVPLPPPWGRNPMAPQRLFLFPLPRRVIPNSHHFVHRQRYTFNRLRLSLFYHSTMLKILQPYHISVMFSHIT